VIERGVDKGLALASCRAPHQNAKEGKTGPIVGLDINPSAGYCSLLPTIVWQGSSMEMSVGLDHSFNDPIDSLFTIADHSADSSQ